MIFWIVQIGLVAFGLTAHWMNQAKDGTRWRKWAPVLGLTAQLFWIGHALTSDPIAWGILGLVVLYGAGWYAGLRREWKPRPNGETA